MNKVLLVNGSNRDAYSYKILKEIEKDVFDAKLIKLNDFILFQV